MRRMAANVSFDEFGESSFSSENRSIIRMGVNFLADSCTDEIRDLARSFEICCEFFLKRFEFVFENPLV